MMPRPVHLMLWALDETPDGYREVVVEANGRIVATAVAVPGLSHEGAALLIDRLLKEARRKC